MNSVSFILWIFFAWKNEVAPSGYLHTKELCHWNTQQCKKETAWYETGVKASVSAQRGVILCHPSTHWHLQSNATVPWQHLVQPQGLWRGASSQDIAQEGRSKDREPWSWPAPLKTSSFVLWGLVLLSFSMLRPCWSSKWTQGPMHGAAFWIPGLGEIGLGIPCPQRWVSASLLGAQG